MGCRDLRHLAAVCGQYCGYCELYRGDRCRGCAYELGATLNGECAIFQCCVAEAGLEHCGLCERFPCPVFVASDTEAGVRRKQVALECRSLEGTERWLERERRDGVSRGHGESDS